MKNPMKKFLIALMCEKAVFVLDKSVEF